MARDLFSNQGSTTVSSGGTTAPSQGTTESWTVASSSSFPAASNAASPATQFYISDPALPAETILVTNVSGTTWSVTRGADGTTPVAHTAGFTVRNVVTAAWLAEIENRITGCYNVLEYGADPTGAADSSTAFQACADAAKAYAASNGRANMTIPSGKFKLNTTFNLIGGGVTISAYGAYIFAGSNSDLFRDWTAQDTTTTLNGMGLQILGGIWDCKGQNWGISSNASLNAGGFSAFTLSNSSNILLQDLTVRNIYDYHGIDINTCDGVIVDNCRFEGFQNNFTWHTSVRLASEAGVNKAITGAVTVDGSAVVTGDRILLKSQTTTTQNGIWVANTAGAWTRPADMDGAGEADRAAVAVTAGTTNTGTAWYQSAVNPTPGTNAMTWVVTTGFNTQSRYFSEAVQIDEGPNNTPSKNITVSNCYMGPAIDGSGLLSFGKMAGSHTDSPSVVYQNIHILGNTSVASLSNSFQGDSWADSVITGNIVLGSSERGIRCLFDSSNTGPRITISGNTISNTTLHGIEIDGHLGTFADVNISNNTITSTSMATANKAIRVDTCSRLTISGNEIQLGGSGDQGIYITGVAGGNITGNSVYNSGLQGIQVNACSNVLVSGNSVIQPSDGGILVGGISTKCSVLSNLIVGANASTTTSNGSVVISGTTNDNIFVSNNRVHKGTGTGSTQPFQVQGAASPTNIEFANNSVGSEWGSNSYANFATLANPSVKLTGSDGVHIARLGSDVGSLTATANASITGLSAALPNAGKYRFKVFGNYSSTGTTRTHAFAVTGPASPTLVSYSESVATSVTGTNVNQSGAYGQNTALTGAAATSATVLGFMIDGYVETTASGTLQIQYKVSSGDTLVIKAGTVLIVERIT